MDRSDKEDIPKFRAALEQITEDLSALSTGTDWTKLRVEPLLEHVTRLDQILTPPKFARETARLRKGVAMFHSDLWRVFKPLCLTNPTAVGSPLPGAV